MRQRSISHSVLGKYEQLIFDTPQEAGHTDLASQGKYGWEIPVDLPTSALLDYVAGKAVLDLGCGWGNTIAIPAMERGAKEVYALDVTPEHLDDNSPLVHKARELGYASLQPVLLREY